VHSFLAGKLFDDRGNRMGPSHAAKGSRRWRYYVSRAVLKGRKQDAGSVARIPAAQIEKQIEEAVAKITNGEVGEAIERVVVENDALTIHLTTDATPEDGSRILTLRWAPPSPYRRRAIIQGDGGLSSSTRPMRVEARAAFKRSLNDAHQWLDELMRDPDSSTATLAHREGKSPHDAFAGLCRAADHRGGDRGTASSRLRRDTADGSANGMVETMGGPWARCADEPHIYVMGRFTLSLSAHPFQPPAARRV
jgi:hypothetical protein